MDEKKVRKEVDEWRRNIILEAINQGKEYFYGDFLIQTIWAVAAEKNPDDIPLIMEIIQKGDDAVRLEAGKALLVYGESATEHLITLINEQSPESAPVALLALAMMRRESDNDLILEMAGHEDAGIRSAAAEALGLLGQPKVAVILHLYGLLEDEVDDVKCAASHAFVLLRHSDAAIPMVQCAAGIASSFHRVQIFDDVSILKNPEVTPYLLAIIREKLEKCRDNQDACRDEDYEYPFYDKDFKPLFKAIEACMAPAYYDELCQMLHPDPLIVEKYPQIGRRSFRNDYFAVHRRLIRIAQVCGDSYADRLSILVRQYLKEADAFLSLRDHPFTHISDFPAYAGVRMLSSLGPRGRVCAYELLHETQMPSLLIVSMGLSEEEEGVSSLLQIALESENESIRKKATDCLFGGDMKEIMQKFITLPRMDEGEFTLNDVEFVTNLNNCIFDSIIAMLFSPDLARRREGMDYFLHGGKIPDGIDIDEYVVFLMKRSSMYVKDIGNTACRLAMDRDDE